MMISKNRFPPRAYGGQAATTQPDAATPGKVCRVAPPATAGKLRMTSQKIAGLGGMLCAEDGVEEDAEKVANIAVGDGGVVDEMLEQKRIR